MRVQKITVTPSLPVQTQEERIVEKEFRVCAYCRISTNEEEQLSSYEAQVEYYTDKILQTPSWRFAGIYADEGIGGTSIRKRGEFNRMIEDCMAGKIDMVLTKTVSRFARNTVDSLKCIRQLKEKNIAVFFEKENINTLDCPGEVLLTILSSVAQQESETISTNTKWGIVRKFEKGELMLNYTNFMGYTKDQAGELTIVPEEAEIVKLVFKLYLEGQSLRKIAKHLEERGIKTIIGKDKWNASTIETMISNEKYMGDALLQKTYTVDCLTKKRVINNGIVPRYYVKNNHEPIIPENLFERVKLEREHRANAPKIYSLENADVQKGRHSQYALSRIVVCGECGRFYRRVTSASYKKHSSDSQISWRCNNRMEYGKKFCQESPTIKEKNLHKSVLDAVNHLIRKKRSTIKRLKKQIAYEHSNNNSAYPLEDMLEFLESTAAEITEYDDRIARKLIDRITVITKERLLVRFKDGTEIEQEVR